MTTLETGRLRIRPFTIDDLPEYDRIMNRQLGWWGRLLTNEELAARLQYQIARTSDAHNPPFGYRAVVLKDAGSMIGMAGFHSRLLSALERQAIGISLAEGQFSGIEMSLGYAFAEEFQGHGFATEAVSALINYAFRGLRLKHIIADTSSGNLPSVGLMKRVGMRVTPCPRPGWPDRVLGVRENDLV